VVAALAARRFGVHDGLILASIQVSPLPLRLMVVQLARHPALWTRPIDHVVVCQANVDLTLWLRELSHAKDAGRVAMKAADEPPPLTHIAEKITQQWIYAWMKNPQAYSATVTMPDFKLSDAAARDISAYLIAQSTPYLPGDAPKAAIAGRTDAAKPAGGGQRVRRSVLRFLPRRPECGGTHGRRRRRFCLRSILG
jgi:hypothetical protein